FSRDWISDVCSSDLRDLHNNIFSATYELNTLQGKLRSSVFGKFYQQKTVNSDPFINDQTNEIEQDVTTATVNDQGYGFALSYAIVPDKIGRASCRERL